MTRRAPSQITLKESARMTKQTKKKLMTDERANLSKKKKIYRHEKEKTKQQIIKRIKAELIVVKLE